MKRFRLVLPAARTEAARAWNAELALTLCAESEFQAMARAKVVLGRQWPVGLARQMIRVSEMAEACLPDR